MNKGTLRRIRKSKGGFTLIELLVVVLIIGILASIAVPQYFKVVEKGKATEALQWVGTVQGAQESYLAQYGNYASSPQQLAVGVESTFNNFTLSPIGTTLNAAGAPNWIVTLTRNGSPAGYGAYQITWSGPPGVFSCSNAACETDLLPQ